MSATLLHHGHIRLLRKASELGGAKYKDSCPKHKSKDECVKSVCKGDKEGPCCDWEGGNSSGSGKGASTKLTNSVAVGNNKVKVNSLYFKYLIFKTN